MYVINVENIECWDFMLFQLQIFTKIDIVITFIWEIITCEFYFIFITIFMII